MKKLPTTIFTGFLGAGKTTIIRNLLEARPDTRFALIINEFGDVGMDSEILRGCGIEDCDDSSIVELANGCICCTVAEEFRPAIESLLDRTPGPDHIIIETSGLALPQPLVRAFNWPGIATRVTVDGVIAVVDAPAVIAGSFANNPDAVQEQRLADENLDHESALAELFEDQLACADLIVINKADDGHIERIERELRPGLRPGVGMLATSDGAVDPRLLIGLELAAESDVDARHEIHHVHDDDSSQETAHGHDEFDTMSIRLPELGEPGPFLDRLRQVIEDQGLLRVKGFASVRNKPLRLVIQAAGPRVDSYFDRQIEPGSDRHGNLVVISQAGFDKAAVGSALGRID